MIRHPRIGQRVRLHYRRGTVLSYNGIVGEVVLVATGPGPRNVAVRIAPRIVRCTSGGCDSCELCGPVLVVPRGNLEASSGYLSRDVLSERRRGA